MENPLFGCHKETTASKSRLHSRSSGRGLRSWANLIFSGRLISPVQNNNRFLGARRCSLLENGQAVV